MSIDWKSKSIFISLYIVTFHYCLCIHGKTEESVQFVTYLHET